MEKDRKALLISLGMVLHMAIFCEILEISWLLWSLLRGLYICLGGRLKNFISHPNLSIDCGSSCLNFLFLLYFHFLSHICKKKNIAKCSLSFQLIKDILLYLKAFSAPSTPIFSLSFHMPCFFPGFCNNKSRVNNSPVNYSQKQDYIIRVTVANRKQMNMSKL